MDGHDWDAIYDTLSAALAVRGKPAMIIAHTIKAKGCCVVENKPESHNIKVPDQATYDKFMNALTDQGHAALLMDNAQEERLRATPYSGESVRAVSGRPYSRNPQ